MKKVSVRTSGGRYDIIIGTGLLSQAGSWIRRSGLTGTSKIMIVTQAPVYRFYGEALRRSLTKYFEVRVHRLPDGEIAKSERELFRLYRELLRQGFERRDGLVALGGGVVGDVTGFAAATYLRGIPYVQIGTTLLAQVDSAIGGKTGINLPEGKNLAGAFYPPRLVISDAGVLKTLPDRHFRASLAEVVKYGVIRSGTLFRFLERNASKILRKDPSSLERIVEESSRIKAQVVGWDEFETRGERMILNFGHTFGHGFEQAGHYRRWLHGEAVSIGMVCAARMAARMKLFSGTEAVRIVRLLVALDLPVSLRGSVKTSEVMRAMRHDKKKRGGRLRFVLPVRLGQVVVRDGVPDKLVQKVIEETGGR